MLRLRPPGRVQKLTNVYLLQDDGAVTVFESGGAGMAAAMSCATATSGPTWRATEDFRVVAPRAIRRMDAGPVKVDETVSDGVAGFEVLHLPGHAPGLIGLWRASDRLAIVSDAVFAWDPFTVSGRPGAPRLPPQAVRPDPEAARASIRRIIELDPASVWLGHYGPLTGDVRGQLERAAASD